MILVELITFSVADEESMLFRVLKILNIYCIIIKIPEKTKRLLNSSIENNK